MCQWCLWVPEESSSSSSLACFYPRPTGDYDCFPFRGMTLTFFRTNRVMHVNVMILSFRETALKTGYVTMFFFDISKPWSSFLKCRTWLTKNHKKKKRKKRNHIFHSWVFFSVHFHFFYASNSSQTAAIRIPAYSKGICIWTRCRIVLCFSMLTREGKPGSS